MYFVVLAIYLFSPNSSTCPIVGLENHCCAMRPIQSVGLAWTSDRPVAEASN
jgi:hypothetical protein